MTIEAKLIGTPTGGHGLTDDILNAVADELVRGKTAGLIPALVLLQPETCNVTPSKKKRIVTCKVVRLEPVTDPSEADRIRMAITESYEARRDNGQPSLDFGEEEARRLLGYVDEWRKERKLTVRALGEIWREHFPPGETGTQVPGDYRKAGQQALLEFCLSNGILQDGDPAATEQQPAAAGEPTPADPAEES